MPFITNGDDKNATKVYQKAWCDADLFLLSCPLVLTKRAGPVTRFSIILIKDRILL